MGLCGEQKRRRGTHTHVEKKPVVKKQVGEEKNQACTYYVGS